MDGPGKLSSTVEQPNLLNRKQQNTPSNSGASSVPSFSHSMPPKLTNFQEYFFKSFQGAQTHRETKGSVSLGFSMFVSWPLSLDSEWQVLTTHPAQTDLRSFLCQGKN